MQIHRIKCWAFLLLALILVAPLAQAGPDSDSTEPSSTFENLLQGLVEWVCGLEFTADGRADQIGDG
ncbi:MAG: hypothetical protein KDI51_16580 [Xanthomonadales bacterium]|nr:hypothetical protein [Xanthomonadales bacterium]